VMVGDDQLSCLSILSDVLFLYIRDEIK